MTTSCTKSSSVVCGRRGNVMSLTECSTWRRFTSMFTLCRSQRSILSGLIRSSMGASDPSRSTPLIFLLFLRGTNLRISSSSPVKAQYRMIALKPLEGMSVAFLQTVSLVFAFNGKTAQPCISVPNRVTSARSFSTTPVVTFSPSSSPACRVMSIWTNVLWL